MKAKISSLKTAGHKRAGLTRTGLIDGRTSPAKHRRPKSFAETIEIERHGVPVADFVEIIDKLKLPNSRIFEIFAIPKSTG